jgi:hypothetical protein
MQWMLALLAAGTAYYVTSRVSVNGPNDLGPYEPGAAYETEYSIGASYSDMAGAYISGDPEFTIDASACPGARACIAPVSFSASLGGDYVATITGRSAPVPPHIRGSAAARTITAHVVGANYSLSGVDNGDGTGTFTLTSTGETDLEGPSFTASTYNGVGTAEIAGTTCGDAIPSGSSCSVVVRYDLPDEAAPYAYLVLQVSGNTREQKPARLTLVLPPPVTD